MQDDEQAFRDCADAFIDHNYEQAANLALNLTQKHFYYWLAQLMLISLERSLHFQHIGPLTDYTRSAFSGHPWELSLLDLTANLATYHFLRTKADTPKKQCQLNYYEGARLLTKGDRQGAVRFFQQSSTIQVECMEHIFAVSELSQPELPDETITRLLSSVAKSAKLNEFTSSADAIDLLIKQVPDAPLDPHCCITRSLEYLLRLLHAMPTNSRSLSQLNEVSEILNRQGPTPTEVDPEFVKDLASSVAFVAKAPLSRFHGLTQQVRTADLTPLQRAALLFGFPLFLGRPKSFQPPEHPIITELRESGMNGSEGSPFCRRRFSGDASEPLSRSRYYAVCTDESGNDKQTLVSELNAYTVPLVTGYVVARPSTNSNFIEILFRGLPGDPNPFYIVVNGPAGASVQKPTVLI